MNELFSLHVKTRLVCLPVHNIYLCSFKKLFSYADEMLVYLVFKVRIFEIHVYISASPQKGPMTPSKQRPGEEGPPPYNGVPENDRPRPGMQKSDSRTLPRDLQRQALRGPDSRSSPALNSKYRVVPLGWNTLLYMESCNHGNCTKTLHNR